MSAATNLIDAGSSRLDTFSTLGNGAEISPLDTTGNRDRESAVQLLEPLICLTWKLYSIKAVAQRDKRPAAQPLRSFFGPKILTKAEQSV